MSIKKTTVNLKKHGAISTMLGNSKRLNQRLVKNIKLDCIKLGGKTLVYVDFEF